MLLSLYITFIPVFDDLLFITCLRLFCYCQSYYCQQVLCSTPSHVDCLSGCLGDSQTSDVLSDLDCTLDGDVCACRSACQGLNNTSVCRLTGACFCVRGSVLQYRKSSSNKYVVGVHGKKQKQTLAGLAQVGCRAVWCIHCLLLMFYRLLTAYSRLLIFLAHLYTLVAWLKM